MPTSLPEHLIDLLRGASLCFISTVMPDGSPQLTQTWVDTDGTHILINTAEGFQKVRNVRRDPRVAVAITGRVLSFPTSISQTRIMTEYAHVVDRASVVSN